MIRKMFFAVCLTLVLMGFVSAEETKTISVNVLAKTDSSWDGNKLPDYAKGEPEVIILKINIPPGSVLPLHKHTVINAGVLLRGELTVVTEDEKVLYLKSGDSIVEVVDKWHFGRNDGNVPAEIIVFYAGIKGAGTTITKAGAGYSAPIVPDQQEINAGPSK
jgi:quercetin dioxygenase-like cupin family protein